MQLQNEVSRLQKGLSALFQAIQKPTADMLQLQSDQVNLNGVVTDLEQTKAEVNASISQLAAKCSQLDQAVPELREKLETAVATITVRQLPCGCLRVFHVLRHGAWSAPQAWDDDIRRRLWLQHIAADAWHTEESCTFIVYKHHCRRSKKI